MSSKNDKIPLVCLVAMFNLRPAWFHRVYWSEAALGLPYLPRGKCLSGPGRRFKSTSDFASFLDETKKRWGRRGRTQRESQGSHLTGGQYECLQGTPGRRPAPAIEGAKSVKGRVSSENDKVPLLCLVAMSNLRPAWFHRAYWSDAALGLPYLPRGKCLSGPGR